MNKLLSLSVGILISSKLLLAQDNTSKSLITLLSKPNLDKETEVLGIKLYNIDGKLNKDVRKLIIKYGKKVEKIFPKGFKGKISSNKIMIFYKYKF